MKLTRSVIEKIEADARIALELVAKKHSISVKMLRGSFTDASYTKKFEFFVPNTDVCEKISPNYIEAWKWNAPMHGLSADLIGTTFQDTNGTMKIVGWNIRAYKSPINLECIDDGKMYKAPVSYVKRFVEVQKSTPLQIKRIQ